MPSNNIISLVDQSRSQTTAPDTTGSIAPNALFYLVNAGDDLPYWWTPARDNALHRLSLTNNHLSGLVYLATTKLVNIPVKFVPRDPTITSHVEHAISFTKQIRLASEDGKGLRQTFKKFAADYLVLDNGAHIEIVGDGAPDGPIVGAPYFLRTLDSMRCERTGNPEYPIKYYHTNGKTYKFHWTRVISLSQQPSSRAYMNDIGFSSMSRSHMLGDVLKDQLTYKRQKMGSMPMNQIVAVPNMEATEIIKAFMIAEDMMTNLGLTHYQKVIALGGENIDLKKVDLNNFEPFNEETGTAMAMFALAFTWGLDVRDIWPVMGSKSGDQIANMKARGRLPADYTGDLGDQMELKVCPSYLEPLFDFQDDEEDQMRSLNADIRARRYERMAKTGINDDESLRRLQLRDGDLDRQEFVRQQWANGKLEDGTPIATLFYSTDPVIKGLVRLPSIEEPLLVTTNDGEQAVSAIYSQEAACLEVVATTGSVSQQRKALQCYYALEWLRHQYMAQPLFLNRVGQEQMVEEQEEGQEPVESERGRDANNEPRQGQNGQTPPTPERVATGERDEENGDRSGNDS